MTDSSEDLCIFIGIVLVCLLLTISILLFIRWVMEKDVREKIPTDNQHDCPNRNHQYTSDNQESRKNHTFRPYTPLQSDKTHSRVSNAPVGCMPPSFSLNSHQKGPRSWTTIGFKIGF